MKIDLYNHESRYASWKENVLKNGDTDLTSKNSKLLMEYIFDMEAGRNTSIKSKKGARGYHRLNAVRQKVSKVFRMLEHRGISDVSKITDKDIQNLFNDMRNGAIKKEDGGKYKSAGDYVKAFKSFWHWYMKVNAIKGKVLLDITEYLDSSTEEKPKWVFLDENQTKELIKECSTQYQTFLEFQYDSGARPQESLSLRGKDISQENGAVYVNLSKEISKSVGRKIKLLLCGRNVLQYIKDNNIGDNDLLFPLSADYINWQLKEVAKKIFKDKESKAGAKYSELSLYDFRHNSCCYWLTKYKNTAGLMYRFGWKQEKYIHYYSEFLGMKDTIRDEDLYVDITKTELEHKIESIEKQSKEKEKMFGDKINLLVEMLLDKKDKSEFENKLKALIPLSVVAN